MLRVCNFILFISLVGCATSSKRVEELSAKNFERTKRRYDVVDDKATNDYVQCVVGALNAALPTPQDWEVVIFKNEEANAFALPGGKLGINSGLFHAALNQDQLAMVLGHEMSHVTAHHGQTRMNQQFALDVFKLTSSIVGRGSEAALGGASVVGGVAQFGILYPFSRAQETEADQIGLSLATRAGFDPGQAIVFWQNMETLGATSAQSPFTDHPAVQSRIEQLQIDRIATSESATALSKKEHPKCVR